MFHSLQRPIGPLSLRAWGLVANLLANLLFVYGLSTVLTTGNGWFALTAGAALTVALIAVLATPS